MQLDQIDQIPRALAEIGPRDILSVFPNPTLIHLAGGRREPLFVSTLLHGNETTSFQVLQYLEARFRDTAPARDLIIFVGNVEATAAGQRFLDGQPDFNRIWAHDSGAGHALADTVLQIARDRNVFASIDVHNNTGDNPVYGCVNVLRAADLHLASHFAPVGVYYLNPSTTQSIAFSKLCPAITLECGRSGDPKGLNSALDLIEYTLSLDTLPSERPPPGALRLYETIGRVVVDPGTPIHFDAAGDGLTLPPQMDALNFTDLPAGRSFGRFTGEAAPLRVLDEHDHDLTSEFFQIGAGELRLKTDVTPAMITRDVRVIRQDCLCYLMRPI